MEATYYERNKEAIKERKRLKYQADKVGVAPRVLLTEEEKVAKKKAVGKAYRLKNKEKVAKAQKKWQDEHKVENAIKSKKYRDNNPELMEARNAKKRLKTQAESIEALMIFSDTCD